MKVLSLVLVLFALFLLTEERKVPSKVKKRDNVYNTYIGGSGSKMLDFLKILDKKLNQILKNTGSSSTGNTLSFPKNCGEVLKCGGRRSGVYTVKPDSKGAFKVYCDQKTDGGGWTVFQKRQDGSVDFYRGWNDYKNGFGNLTGEFWLGLEKIYRLTRQTRNRLRVELEDWENNTVYAEYDYFAVSSERIKYKLSLGIYSGTAGDSFSSHCNMAFSTKDRDSDRSSSNCAVTYKGAWWYGSCHVSNLNGLYHHGHHNSYADGVNWNRWKGHRYSAKRAEMKIRPV